MCVGLAGESDLSRQFFSKIIRSSSTMKFLTVLSLASLGHAFFSLQAGEITYQFDDADGVVDTNTIGASVTAGNVTLATSSGGSTAFQNSRAELGVREPNPTLSCAVTVPAGSTLDLTSLSFDYGFNEASHPNNVTPSWSLAITTGSGTPSTNSLPTVTGTGFTFQNESIALTGLTGLTDTTVTFTLTFDTTENRHSSISRAHTVDNLTLSGSSTIDTEPTITSFTADDTVVDPGQTVTLSWSASGADSLTINPGNIDVTSDPDNQIDVVVNAAATYTLTASNSDGDTVENLTIHLNPTVPNVLVVIVDDMGTEDTSVDFNYTSAGSPIDRIDPTSVGLDAFTTDNRHYTTPNMETLASQGMKFSRAYACQVCSPTRVTFMTGQNSARHGTIQYIGGGGSLHNIKAPPNPGLKDYNRTIAEVLRDSGYRTIMSGKGHIGNSFNGSANNYKTPAAPADDYYGYQVNVSASTNGQQGSCYSNASTAFGLPSSGPPAHFIAEYQDKTYNQIDPVNYPVAHPQADEPVFVTDAITRELNERIEDSVNEGKPFFACLSHFAVHDPHQPDPRFTANYPTLSGDVLDFATMIEGMDQSLGDVLAKLDELGVAENTLVIFLGDNGSDAKPRGSQNPGTLTMTNPLRGEKGMRFEGGIRIPLIVSWAKLDETGTNTHQQTLSIAEGGREDDIVSVEDLFPTILSACGIPLPTQDDNGDPLIIDGADLTPYLKSVVGTHRVQKLITHAPCSSRSSFFTTYHEGTWKLIYNYATSSPITSTSQPLGTYELYDLATDPHEANNLSATEPDRVMAMARGMVAELERLGAPYPILRAYDSDLDALGLPSAINDLHPVILPALSGVDGDNDGLDDNVEDPNRNGQVDPGETDADNDNSDGDNIKDGDEVKIGADPLDANSYFKVEPSTQPDGSFLISWPSAPSASFTIRSSADLNEWTSVVASGIPASAGASTSYNLSIPGGARLFYRVELE